MKTLLTFLGLFCCTTLFAGDNSSPPHVMHAPFKERIWVGPGYTAGVDNVLRGYLEAGANAETLVSKGIGDKPVGWRCGIDPYSWFMYNASNWENRIFDLKLANPLRLILESDGRLHIVDTQHRDIWSRGPFGSSSSYQLMVSDEGAGDLVLYDGAGRIVWSARRDGV